MSIEEEFFRRYKDRGIIKYMGFYLSEHTSALSIDKNSRNNFIAAKPKMEEIEIHEILEEAFHKNLVVAVQIDEKNENNSFGEDITGKLSGFDEQNIYIGKTPISYDLIRHITLV